MDDRNAVTHVEETVQNGDKVVLPAIYLDASKDDLAELIADMLERVIAINDRIPLVPAALTRFHSRTPPTISVLDYIRRIVAYASPDRTVMLAPLHYLSTIANRLPLFALSSLTVHRFLISAIAAASKGLCDTFCTNSLYARVGGITVQELNTLEREFLAAVDWQLVCSYEILQEYYVNLIRTHRTSKFTLAGASPSSSTSPVASSPEPESAARALAAQSAANATASVEQSMAFAALQQQDN